MYIKRFFSFINESQHEHNQMRDKDEITEFFKKNFFKEEFNKLQYELNSTKFITNTTEPWISIYVNKTKRWNSKTTGASYTLRDIGYVNKSNTLHASLSNSTLNSRINTLDYLYSGKFNLKDRNSSEEIGNEHWKQLNNKFRDFFEIPVPPDKIIIGEDVFSELEINFYNHNNKKLTVEIKYRNHFITNNYTKVINKSENVVNQPKEELNELILSAFNELHQALLNDKPIILVEKEKEINRFTKSVFEELCGLPNFIDILFFINKYMPVLFENFRKIPIFYENIYKKILTLDKHLDILHKIKKEYPELYVELIKFGNKYTDKLVGSTDIDDMLNYHK